MKFLLFVSTFLVVMQSAYSQSVTGEAPLFGERAFLREGRRVSLTGSSSTSDSRTSGFTFFPEGRSLGSFSPRSVGVTVTGDILKTCTEMEIAAQAGVSPSSFVDNLIATNRFNLQGIPRQKLLDVFDFYRKPYGFFGGATSLTYIQTQKRANCEVGLGLSLSSFVNAQIKPDVSGLDPASERKRSEAERQITEDQLKQCQEKAGNFSLNCFPESGSILNPAASTDIFNLSNALNIPYTFQATENLPRLGSLRVNGPLSLSELATQTIRASTNIDDFLSPRQKLCNCNNDNYKPHLEPIAKIQEEREKIAKLVRERLYKKFLNDYAQNREDINFFMNHRGNILNGHDSEALACKDQSQFQQRAKEKCSANGVSEEDRKKREAELFSKLKIENPASDMSVNWKHLDSKISTIEFPEGTTGLPENINAKGLNRIAFDQVRHGFSEDTRSRAFNKILTGLVKDPHFREWAGPRSHQTPAASLMDYLFQIKSDPAKVEAIANLAASEHAFDRAAFKENIDENFVKLMQDVTAYSPEMRISLSNYEIFNAVIEQAKEPGFKDFKSVVANDPNSAGTNGPANLIHDKHLKLKCGQIMESFANALCADNSHLVDNSDPDDLKRLIQQNPSSDIDEQYATHLTCKMSGFNLQLIPLDIDAPYSSLLSRVVEGQKDFFANIKDSVLRGDRTVISYISGVAREASDSSVEIDNKDALHDNNSSISGGTYSPRLSGSGKSSLWDHVDSSGSFREEPVYSNNKLVARQENVSGSKERSSTESSTKQDADKTGPDQTTDQVSKDLKTTPDPATFGTTYSSRSTNDKSPQETPAKNELRQSLGTDGNKPEVQQQISRIDDDMAAELNRLREEAAQNRQKLAELTSQAQESKIRMLQDQLKRLQDERRTVVEASPVPVVNPETKNDFIIGAQKGSTQNREIASDGAVENEGAKSTPGQKTAVTSPDPTAVSGNSNSVRGQSRGDTPSGESSSGSGSAPLVVTSTAVRSEAAVDMNLEIIKFLDAANPDLTTLTQIKDQGLLYRYKVVVNGVEREQEVLIRFSGLNENARQALERKINQRRTENPRLAQVEDSISEVQRKVSYESLRYIIGQQLSR